MAVTPAIVLAKLQGLNITTDVIDHPAVTTVEEANKFTGGDPGLDVKNLFLQDKKNRLFLVTAATATKIDLKALGVRLGLPKPGVRMAPPELLDSVLGVPLGSLTPLAVVQPTAHSVVLLLDQKLKDQERILLHPLTNTSIVAISSQGLEAFLKSLDREAHYVDLEAQPVTGPGQADLRHLLPADTNAETSGTSATSTAGHASNNQSDTGASSGSSSALNPANAPVGAKATKCAKAGKGASAKGGKKGANEELSPSLPSTSLQDVAMELVQQVLQGVSVDATTLSPETTKQLSDVVFLRLNSLQNTAYSNGYKGAKHEVAEYCMKTFGG